MNRLERLSAILIKLQSKPIITARQIAEQFDISLRTVYRDIKALEEAGIPLIGNVGEGYSLIDGFKLPPLMFTRDEAVAFLTAEKFIERMTDLQNVQNYKSGMDKIRAVLRYAEKDYISGVENNIRVMGRQNVTGELPKAITQCILQSISEKKVMRIGYQNTEKISSERDVEPIGCFYSEKNWYLIAFCKLKDEYRSFRIDRITDFHLKAEPFSQIHLSLPEYMEKHRFDKPCHEVVIRVKNSDMKIIEGYTSYHGWIKDSKTKENTDIYFRIFNLEHFARWYMSCADIATIVQPDMLKNEVKKLLDKIKLNTSR